MHAPTCTRPRHTTSPPRIVHRCGEEILRKELPAKREVVVKLALTPTQHAVYQRYITVGGMARAAGAGGSGRAHGVGLVRGLEHLRLGVRSLQGLAASQSAASAPFQALACLSHTPGCLGAGHGGVQLPQRAV